MSFLGGTGDNGAVVLGLVSLLVLGLVVIVIGVVELLIELDICDDYLFKIFLALFSTLNYNPFDLSCLRSWSVAAAISSIKTVTLSWKSSML